MEDDWYVSYLPVPIEFIGRKELTNGECSLTNRRIESVYNQHGVRAIIYVCPGGFMEVVNEDTKFRLARGKTHG